MITVTETAAASRFRSCSTSSMSRRAGCAWASRPAAVPGSSTSSRGKPAPRENDLVFEGPSGVRVWIDPRSHRLLDGTTLDYDTSLLSRGFVFQNPHAKSTCGCGTSFSV